MKGDQRILGDSGFVCDVLKEEDERFERYYEMSGWGMISIRLKIGYARSIK